MTVRTMDATTASQCQKKTKISDWSVVLHFSSRKKISQPGFCFLQRVFCYLFSTNRLIGKTKHLNPQTPLDWKFKGISVSAALHEEPYILFSTENKSLLCIKCFRDMQVWVNLLFTTYLLHLPPLPLLPCKQAVVCFAQGESDPLHWHWDSLRAGLWDAGPGCFGETAASDYAKIWWEKILD